MLLGLESTINPQRFIKIVGSIFEKIEMFHFLSCELSLIFNGKSKIKEINGMEIFLRDPRHRI